MNGTFNNVRIENVIALKLEERQNTLRVLGCPTRDLEQQFKLRSRVSVRVSIHQFEGIVVRYRREPDVYEVTIKNEA